jgi:hypothetical protein
MEVSSDVLLGACANHTWRILFTVPECSLNEEDDPRDYANYEEQSLMRGEQMAA